MDKNLEFLKKLRNIVQSYRADEGDCDDFDLWLWDEIVKPIHSKIIELEKQKIIDVTSVIKRS